MSIYSEINKYIDQNIYPFHMPGHKRNEKYLKFSKPIINYDITEFGNMDNLHAPQGIIKEVNKRIASLFNAQESFLMVNGSSGGIIAAIMTVCKDNEKILIGRNCHKSVFNGLIYAGGLPKYVYPSVTNLGLAGGINPNDIKQELEKDKSIKAVLITSPTYEGFVSDIYEIAKIVHEYGKILIVDEAHGTHFNFNENFPKTALSQGADIVIQSLHKTLPVFTQAAVLHVQGNRVNKDLLANNLSMAQTTSPSYIFMAAIDLCLSFLEKNHKNEFDMYVNRLKNFRNQMHNNKNIALIGNEMKNKYNIKDMDMGKLVFYINREISGKQIDRLLYEKHKIQLELSSNIHILALTSIADTNHGFNILEGAINTLNKEIEKEPKRQHVPCIYPKAITELPPRHALRQKSEKVEINKAVNKVCAQFITPYPPGIPLITPGEVITKEIIEILKETENITEINIIK